MVKFLLYLFESGLCLSILFLVYVLFFRKETYFRFNRIYLLSIMFLSLLVPFMHINVTVTDTQRYEHTINEIGKFKTYYEKLIAMSDPEFLQSQRNFSNGFEDFGIEDYTNVKTNGNNTDKSASQETDYLVQPENHAKLSTASVIFIIYLVGVLIFLSRIIILFHWIYRTISKNNIERIGDLKLVYTQQNLPPFSFMGYVFVNQNNIADKSEEILAHEKVHIKQLHSIDLLLAHSLSIFQWFNPFVWFLHKSIKTNHEYLADSKVVNNGYNLLDYQELLLNQFISIPSVQLVNNFNLISIKNRINMMNKIKSGFLAKLKALLIIPAALFAFILFANLTLNSPGKVLSNLSFFDIQNNMNELKGMWDNVSNDTYGYKVLFENSKFSVLEKNIILKEYPYQLQGNQIVLSLPNNEKVEVKYEFANNQLKIWWNDAEYSTYKKTTFTNTLDEYLATINPDIDLPVIENYWLLQRLDLCIDVAMIKDKIYVNKKLTEYSNLKDALLKAKSKINHLNTNLITVRIFADKDLSMEYMNKLQQTLREIDLLKVAYAGKVNDPKVSKLQLGYIGMPKKLPPLNGIEILDKNEIVKKGFAYFDIDATKEENTPENLKPKFKETVSNSDKYIANLYYDKTTSMNTYLGYQDMARTVIYGFREDYALKNYNMSYDDLSSIQQQEIKKKFPLIISEAEAFKPRS